MFNPRSGNWTWWFRFRWHFRQTCGGLEYVKRLEAWVTTWQRLKVRKPWTSPVQKTCVYIYIFISIGSMYDIFIHGSYGIYIRFLFTHEEPMPNKIEETITRRKEHLQRIEQICSLRVEEHSEDVGETLIVMDEHGFCTSISLVTKINTKRICEKSWLKSSQASQGWSHKSNQVPARESQKIPEFGSGGSVVRFAVLVIFVGEVLE